MGIPDKTRGVLGQIWPIQRLVPITPSFGHNYPLDKKNALVSFAHVNLKTQQLPVFKFLQKK
jgi:hypothetical protein